MARDRTPITRDRLTELPAGTELLREIRYASADELAEVTDDELAAAIRWLRAASHSCLEGARRLAAEIASRNNRKDPNR